MEAQQTERITRKRPNRWLLLAVGLLLLFLVLLVVWRATADPNAEMKALALRHAQALAERNYAQRWEDAPPACQSDQPKAQWIAAQQRLGGQPPIPLGTYQVVGVNSFAGGTYKTVTVRVTSGGDTSDWDFAIAQYNSRWAVADWERFGDAVQYGCKF